MASKFTKFVKRHFALGVLKPKHIIIVNNKIGHIEKLHVDESDFFIDEKLLATYYKSKTTINYVTREQFISSDNIVGTNLKPISFRKEWEKYLKPIEAEVNSIYRSSLAKSGNKNMPIASTIDQIDLNPLKIDFEMTGPSALS